MPDVVKSSVLEIRLHMLFLQWRTNRRRGFPKVATLETSQKGAVPGHCGMPETEPQSTVILIAIYFTIFLLVVIILMIARIFGRLKHLEGQFSRGKSNVEVSEPVPSVAETSPGGAFEAFLAEDPGRLQLTKKEQFAAYRKWRQENGLNWSNS